MKKLCLILACAAGLVCITAFVQNTRPVAGGDEKIIAMRSIGHALLLEAGDATSVLPPVKTMGENAFQIQFPHALTLVPDSLVKIVASAVAKTTLPRRYIVKVVDGASGDMVYGYEISGNPGQNIIPCLGRVPPAGNYAVIISFGTGSSFAVIFSSYILPSAGLFLAVCSLAIFAAYNKKPQAAAVNEQGAVSIGEYLLYTGNGVLKYKGAVIGLTGKEIKLLAVFASQPNVIIGRQELIKTVWEDEGVLTGSRSLDVFVSKLRKKLAEDPAVNIVNVHGMGYRLEIATG